jgi:putative membrane protein
MMNGYYGSGSSGGWLAMGLMMIVLAGLIVFAAVALSRGSARSSADGGADRADPRQILQERLARGEIQVEEYEARRDALTTTPRR